MSTPIRPLLVLQDRDRRLLALGKELERLPAEEQRAKAKLSGDEAALAKAHDALRHSELDFKKLELDSATRRTTVQRLKHQQFETRKNDEYQAISHEVTRYEKELDELETRELELMECADALRATQKRAEQALAKTKAEVQEDLSALTERRSHLEAEISALRGERATLAADIPDGPLALYERLLKSKGGMAIAPMQDGRCGGCHMKLIPATVIKVQSGKDLAQCEDCARILYLGE
jgi:predicted  nucleic acid-binding Zn-ribbon protein